MGTNYRRIPTSEEMEARRKRLEKTVKDLIMEPVLIEREFQITKEDSWDSESPWDKFLEGTAIHLGKRSGGWKFCWNFHNNKDYSSKEELIQFVLSGRVVDEYGEEIDPQEFLDMAFKINMMQRLSSGLEIHEVMPMNVKMTPLFRYFNVLLYPFCFAMANGMIFN